MQNNTQETLEQLFLIVDELVAGHLNNKYRMEETESKLLNVLSTMYEIQNKVYRGKTSYRKKKCNYKKNFYFSR